MTKALIGFFTILAGVGLGLLLGAFLALPVMWLVNGLFTPAIIASLFGPPQLSFTHAWGLSVLCSILFKSLPSK